MNKKYEFTGEALNRCGRILHRIRALRDFGNVRAGDIGGWIEKEENLSHKGYCWVYDEAMVGDDACVSENAKIYNNVKIYGKAILHGDAEVYENVQIYDSSEVYGHSEISGNAVIYEKAKVGVNSKIYGDSKIFGNAWICGNSKIYGRVMAYGNCEIYEFAEAFGEAVICENSKIHGHTKICGRAVIRGSTEICMNVIIGKNALIESSRDYIFIGPVGRRNRISVAFKTDDDIGITIGCFYGNIEEFEDKIKKTHKNNIYGSEYAAFAEFLRIRFNKKFPQTVAAVTKGENE